MPTSRSSGRHFTPTLASRTPNAMENRLSELIYDCIEEWSSEAGDDIYGRIVSVTQAGDVASVLLGFDYKPDLPNGWVDIHSLLKLDLTWKTMKQDRHSRESSRMVGSARSDDRVSQEQVEGWPATRPVYALAIPWAIVGSSYGVLRPRVPWCGVSRNGRRSCRRRNGALGEKVCLWGNPEPSANVRS